MDKDYQNFVDRMGSFEDEVDMTQNDKTTSRPNELKHYGVLGMRWGRHRAINSTTIGAAAKTGQNAAVLGQTVRKGKINKKSMDDAKKLSDDDLKTLTSRLELENRYINAQTQQAGRSKVESILSTTVATMAVISSAAVMVDAINKARG